jgi:hypothetical protein
MTPETVRRRRTFHVFGFLGTALLVGSLLSAGFVFFLHASSQSKLDTAQRELSAQKELFDADKVREIKEFDRRLKVASILLKNHISPLHLFTALEAETKKRIQFTSFTLERTSMSEVLVSLVGRTEAFKILALQEIGFSSDPLLKNIIFSEVATFEEESSPDGGDTSLSRGITFTLSGSVDTSLIRYDGTPYKTNTQTYFEDREGSLVAVTEPEGIVLDASISNE